MPRFPTALLAFLTIAATATAAQLDVLLNSMHAQSRSILELLTNSPAMQPATHNTAAASNPGWLYGYNWSSGDCSGIADYSMGIVTNTCLTPTNTNNTAPVSYLFTCTPATGSVTIYDSLDCDPSTARSPHTCALMCMPTDRGSSAQAFCSTASTITLQKPFVLARSFNDSTCTNIADFQGVRNGACVAGGSDSTRIFYPKAYLYTGVTDCSGKPGAFVTYKQLARCVTTPFQQEEAGECTFPYSDLFDVSNTVSL